MFRASRLQHQSQVVVSKTNNETSKIKRTRSEKPTKNRAGKTFDRDKRLEFSGRLRRNHATNNVARSIVQALVILYEVTPSTLL